MSDNWNFKGLAQDVLVKSNTSSCCNDSSSQDTSKIENPSNPINHVTNEFIKDFEKYLKELGIINVSYVNNVKDCFLHNLDFDFEAAIVFSYEIRQCILDAGPGSKAQKYNSDLYADFGNLTYKISDYLRLRGFETMVAHPRKDTVDFLYLAQKGKMGVIGKSGLLISPHKGPNQKIAAILVNIKNLPETKNNNYEWISDYCNYCNSCVRACPNNALILDKKNQDVNFSKESCIGCSEGCTECIKSCPFYKKEYELVFEKYKKIKSDLKSSR